MKEKLNGARNNNTGCVKKTKEIGKLYTLSRPLDRCHRAMQAYNSTFILTFNGSHPFIS